MIAFLQDAPLFYVHFHFSALKDYFGMLTRSLDIFSQQGKKGLAGSKADAKGKYKYL